MFFNWSFGTSVTWCIIQIITMIKSPLEKRIGTDYRGITPKHSQTEHNDRLGFERPGLTLPSSQFFPASNQNNYHTDINSLCTLPSLRNLRFHRSLPLAPHSSQCLFAYTFFFSAAGPGLGFSAGPSPSAATFFFAFPFYSFEAEI